MLIISLQQKEEIIEQAKEALPHEACGILAGKNGKAEKVYKMTNTSKSPETCYFMDPKEQFKVMKEIRNLGLEMLGIYHSHTGSEAYPSSRDVELAFYPDAYYIIISLRNINNPEVRAFKIVEGKITEEEIKLE
ncbi:MAG: M67 family metallopeptidase [Candidatus Margulisiibacteriota bacterium]